MAARGVFLSLPFDQIQIAKKSFIRTFSNKVNSEELYWHMDKNDREILVLSGENWFFQEEDKLPIKLSAGDLFTIKKNTWHRVIKGSGSLSVIIKES